MINTLGAWASSWLQAGFLEEIPEITPIPIPGLQELSGKLLGWAKWTLMLAGVLGLMICGGMMILGRRNRSSTAVDGAVGIPWVIGGLTVGAIATFVVGVALPD
ncbi:hypothetical protein AB0I28_33010 [Phytomonospora sp. NPDC050363]|uniref:hypothetical protein n=1 Tax=Phytomonospora sp. NPDC050363 TaxID=3155642 RepID=UPI003409EEB3